jgi:hypothetical protein
VPPLRGLRPATKGAFPLGTPAALLAQISKLASNSAFALLSFQSRNRARSGFDGLPHPTPSPLPPEAIPPLRGLSDGFRRFRTPTNAILFQAAWAIFLLLFWVTFANIITYLVFMDALFMVMVGISVVKLRRTRKDIARPYRTLGYPVTPAVFLLITIFFLISTLVQKPVQACAALACLLLDLPFYFYFRKKPCVGSFSAGD